MYFFFLFSFFCFVYKSFLHVYFLFFKHCLSFDSYLYTIHRTLIKEILIELFLLQTNIHFKEFYLLLLFNILHRLLLCLGINSKQKWNMWNSTYNFFGFYGWICNVSLLATQRICNFFSSFSFPSFKSFVRLWRKIWFSICCIRNSFSNNMRHLSWLSMLKSIEWSSIHSVYYTFKLYKRDEDDGEEEEPLKANDYEKWYIQCR